MQINYLDDVGFILKGDRASVALACQPEQTKDADIIITNSENEKVKPSKEQIVFDWPGEYESRGISTMIITVGKENVSRVVKVIVDEIAFAHLDDIAEPLTETEEEEIGNVDVLFVSIGKNAKLDSGQVKNIIEVVEPRIVIPMNFTAGEEQEFAKQLGFGDIVAEDVLKLKRSDLPADRMELKILKPKK